MIVSSVDYLEYIEAELGYVVKSGRLGLEYLIVIFSKSIGRHPLESFQFYLRLYEYLRNNRKAALRRLRMLWAGSRYRKFSVACGFTIPLNCFGKGLSLPHHGGIIVNGKVKVGNNCSIRPFTVIGNKRNGLNDEVPVIGDNVTIGCNVSIIGGVRIGNDVTIGAGAVVIHDVPDGCVVAGNPARVIG